MLTFFVHCALSIVHCALCIVSSWVYVEVEAC